jgi:DNA polymerase V
MHVSKPIPFKLRKAQSLPLYLSRVEAGFPSPADDHLDKALDLNELLVANQAATYFVRVAGDSMTGAGIHDGDLLVVDRSLEPGTGKIVIACVDGEFTVKRLLRKGGRPWLMPENPAYRPMEIKEERDISIWGVVTAVVRQV